MAHRRRGRGHDDGVGHPARAEGIAAPGRTFASLLVGDTLHFNADVGTHSLALWRTDGTTDGTALVKQFDPVAGWDVATPVGETLNFAVHRRLCSELWRSDGKTEGTVRLKTAPR